ncbi:N-acetylmuramic acid 6-phosphate etherase [Vibrio sp. SS-MA-C1-2]|uniref:N-acetylmuramic acid 6-phosphate etherase n=1 Tax=Vibrio sp. SS-MA-C1-2 TaxID=2908646 RepID=UPI001F3D7943|nr:N-acetylmuramic acid 6-phosphate etherase [Vibrio sp. SS-MA-C1-2]UJF18204.1 N-acetylmuramic acid 6-phosphate etherase [Vibrio sp. SS-MA-C1-2]
MKIELNGLVTEGRNKASEMIDMVSTEEMLKIINNEDKKVALAVEAITPTIAQVVDAVVDSFKKGGRLIYIGAGTSGRLGILDASECPPTFGTPKEQVVGIIAGGHQAILSAVENAEDNREMGQQDLKDLNFNANDTLVGIAASGRTPYVIAAMEYAKQCGAKVGSISCNPESEMAKLADFPMVVVVGPEVVTGSSRMKAGTAQKLVLNMISTGAMIRSGKIYGNLMVDVEATNAKLIERQKKIVMEATDCSYEQAAEALSECNNHCKTAIVKILTKTNAVEAASRLEAKDGFIRQALK